MLDKLALILIILCALNLGSIGIFGFDFISWMFGGQATAITRIFYSLAGIAGIWCVSLLFRRRNPILHADEA